MPDSEAMQLDKPLVVDEPPSGPLKAEGSAATQAAIAAATAAIDKATASANELSNPIAQSTADTGKTARDKLLIELSRTLLSLPSKK